MEHAVGELRDRHVQAVFLGECHAAFVPKPSAKVRCVDKYDELIPWPASENAIHRIAQAWDPEDGPSPEDNVWLGGRDLGYRAIPIKIR